MSERPALSVLEGVRLLSITQFLLGPSGVQFLADMGADVVKIEPPGGALWERHWSGCNLFLNGVSAFFLLAHRNQRSLTLDLKKPEGLAVARRLVESADVLVQNFRPGVMQRLGPSLAQMAPEMAARDGFVGGVQPLDLRESGEGRPQVGRIDGTRLVMMGQMADFSPLG